MTGGDVALPPGDVPHVVVADIESPAVDDTTHHHLTRVLRLRPGDGITATDGAGHWRPCRLDEGSVEEVGPVVMVERLEPQLTVAFALTKGAKPELVIQKLTELGVDRIVPFMSERSIVRWSPAKADSHHERWVTIARGAVAQSRRCWLPVIDPLRSFADIVSLGAVPVHRGGRPLNAGDRTVAVGPEGGWTPEELDSLEQPVGLGPNVLRAETAAIAAGTLLVALRTKVVSHD